jgi:hypothetical protein
MNHLGRIVFEGFRAQPLYIDANFAASMRLRQLFSTIYMPDIFIRILLKSDRSARRNSSALISSIMALTA